MNDFDWDAHQKKLIAQGARHKKKPKKGCTLPSDYMTPAQKRKLNGEVTTVALNKPMTWEELDSLPDDIQREYINGLRDKYQANDAMIGGMLGRCEEIVRRKRMELGGEWAKLPRRVPVPDAMARADLWDEFLGKETTKEWIENNLPKETEEPVQPKKLAVRSEINVTIAGADNWEEVVEVLKAYPKPSGMVVSIRMFEGVEVDNALPRL